MSHGCVWLWYPGRQRATAKKVAAVIKMYTTFDFRLPPRNCSLFWFWGFCTVCEVNLPVTFRKPLWVPFSLAMSKISYSWDPQPCPKRRR